MTKYYIREGPNEPWQQITWLVYTQMIARIEVDVYTSMYGNPHPDPVLSMEGFGLALVELTDEPPPPYE